MSLKANKILASVLGVTLVVSSMSSVVSANTYNEKYEVNEAVKNGVCYPVALANAIIDGKEMTNQYGGMFIDNQSRVQVPIRAFAETVGCNVEWDESTQTVVLTKPFVEGTNVFTVKFRINDNTYEGYARPKDSNDESENIMECKEQMDTVPTIYMDRTYIPLRYACESLLYKVTWDSDTNTATCIRDVCF